MATEEHRLVQEARVRLRRGVEIYARVLASKWGRDTTAAENAELEAMRVGIEHAAVMLGTAILMSHVPPSLLGLAPVSP